MAKAPISPLTDTQLRATPLPVAVVSTVASGTGAVGQKSMDASSPVVIADDQTSIPVVIQNTSRTTLAMTAEFTFAQTAETLLTMTLSANAATASTFTSRVITSGKKMRIQSAILQVEGLGSGTAPQRAYLRMRADTTGATTAASPLQWILPCGVTTAIVKASDRAMLNIPEGFQLNGNGTTTFGFTLETPDWVVTTATGRAKITIIGMEY